MSGTTGARLAAAAALVLAAAASAAAGASAFEPKQHALLGGGRIGAHRTANHLDVDFTTVRISKDGKTLHFYGDWTAFCDGGAVVTANVDQVTPIRSDGSFSGSGSLRSSIAEGTFRFEGKLSRLAVEGQTIEAASGTGRSQLTFHPSPSRRKRCRTPLVSWEARSNPRITGQPRPKKDGLYYGSNSQTEPFVLRVSPDGRRIVQAGTEFRLRCKRGSVVDDGDVVPATPIQQDGRFSQVASYRSHAGDLRWGAGNVAHYIAAIRGRFGAASVSGSLQVDVNVRDRSGKLIDTCRAFTTFAASL